MWASNLDEEFDTVMRIVQKYNYVAVDSKFPGVPVRPADPERELLVCQYAH